MFAFSRSKLNLIKAGEGGEVENLFGCVVPAIKTKDRKTVEKAKEA